jgi:hypothetical protein
MFTKVHIPCPSVRSFEGPTSGWRPLAGGSVGLRQVQLHPVQLRLPQLRLPQLRLPQLRPVQLRLLQGRERRHGETMRAVSKEFARNYGQFSVDSGFATILPGTEGSRP